MMDLDLSGTIIFYPEFLENYSIFSDASVRATTQFNFIDQNNDGLITQADLENYLESKGFFLTDLSVLFDKFDA